MLNSSNFDLKSLINWSILEFASHKVVSSAKRIVDKSDSNAISLIKIINKRGPSIEPCGTPN